VQWSLRAPGVLLCQGVAFAQSMLLPSLTNLGDLRIR
jgi:hypothetical protein